MNTTTTNDRTTWRHADHVHNSGDKVTEKGMMYLPHAFSIFQLLY